MTINSSHHRPDAHRVANLAVTPPNGAAWMPEPAGPASAVPEPAALASPGPASAGPADLAEASRQRRRDSRSRRSQQRRLGRTRRGGRIARGDAIAALVTEQEMLGEQRDPSQATYGETVVHGLGKAIGDAQLSQTQRKVNRIVRRSERLKVRQAALLIRAGHRPGDRVRHPLGGYRTALEARKDEDALRAGIAADAERGSGRHLRLPAWLRRVPAAVALGDFCILFYFFAGVTNVNWSQLASASTGFALVIAALVTGVAYSFLALAGNRMRNYKDGSGAVAVRELDGLTKATAYTSAAAIVVLAGLMFTRMRAELLDALGPHAAATAIVIGVALAAVSILANCLVMLVHALDGSQQVDQAQALGAAVHRSFALAHRQAECAAVYGPLIAALGRQARRAAVLGITDAGRRRAAADQIIDAARAVHQGAGPFSEPAVSPNEQPGVVGYRHSEAMPEVDERPLRRALEDSESELIWGLPTWPDRGPPAR